jgi:hypothetical protein
MQDVVLSCNSCGAYNESSIYQTARGGLRYLLDENLTTTQLQELLAVLRRAKDTRTDPVVAAAEASDEVKRFVDLLPKTRQDYYVLIGILIALLTLWVATRPSPAAPAAPPPPPTDNQIARIVNDVLRGTRTSVVAPTAPSKRPVGWNHPCWCGSGRKLKLCHRGEVSGR